MRLGALTHWLPAKSSFFESSPRRSLRYPRTFPWFASVAALLRRLRASTNHFSPNFGFLLHHGRAGLNVSLDGCSGGLYLDESITRSLFKESGRRPLSLCTGLSFFIHVFFYLLTHDLILFSSFLDLLILISCVSCSRFLFFFFI